MLRHPACLTVLVLFVSIASVGQEPTTLYVSVMSSKSGPLTELKKENFRVSENKVEQTVQSVTFGGEPTSIGFVFDVSPSATKSDRKVEVDQAAHGMYELAKKLGSGNEYFVVGFNRKTILTADWTNDEKAVAAGLGRLRELQGANDGKFTPLNHVVAEAIGKLKTGKHSKRVLVLFTDGLDSGYGKGKDDLRRLAFDEQILFYPILFPTQPLFGQSPAFDSAYLEEISALTGGRSLYYTSLRRRIVVSATTPQVYDIRDDTFALLFELLNSHYKIQYTPSENAPPKKRKLKLDVVISPEIKKGKGDIYILHRQLPIS